MFLLIFSFVLSLASSTHIAETPEEKYSCPMQGLDCAFHDIERARDCGTWQECASQCHSNKFCAFWSWHVPDAWVSPYGCWLKSACDLTVNDINVISGYYTC